MNHLLALVFSPEEKWTGHLLVQKITQVDCGDFECGRCWFMLSSRLGTPPYIMVVVVRELPQNAHRYLSMVEIILSEVRKRLFCMIFSSSLVKDDSIR